MDGVGEAAVMTGAAETIGWNDGGVVVVDVAGVGGVDPMDGDHILLGALCLGMREPWLSWLFLIFCSRWW